MSLIVTWLIEVTNNNIAPAFYMMIAAICALITTLKSERMKVSVENVCDNLNVAMEQSIQSK